MRLYPGPLSQVIEGMDSILRMPGGCFEQTSSSTYPNVLALDYMKRTKKLTPEVHAKAEGFIANGYQRLLTFEVPGGGFSWFGQCAGEQDSDGVRADGVLATCRRCTTWIRSVIERTQQWLAAQQQADGSWKPDTQFINEGATNRYNSRCAADHGVYRVGAGEYRVSGRRRWSRRSEYVEQHMDARSWTRTRWR